MEKSNCQLVLSYTFRDGLSENQRQHIRSIFFDAISGHKFVHKFSEDDVIFVRWTGNPRQPTVFWTTTRFQATYVQHLTRLLVNLVSASVSTIDRALIGDDFRVNFIVSSGVFASIGM